MIRFALRCSCKQQKVTTVFELSCKGETLFTRAQFDVVSRELRYQGDVHYAMVEAIQAWFEQGRGLVFPINDYVVRRIVK